MILRDYQAAAIQSCRDEFRAGRRRILLVAPTGAGKTAIASSIIQSARSALFVAHRRELVGQASARLSALGIRHGIIRGDADPIDSSAPVQVASVQTLIRRQFPDARVLIFDEAHLSLSSSFLRVAAGYHESALIGLTATPCRLDGRGLGDLYQSIVQAETVPGLIKRGILVPVEHYAPHTPNLTRVGVSRGDYQISDLADAVDQPGIVGSVVDTWLRHAPDRTVVFAVNIEHSNHLSAEFRARGVSAEHLDGETPDGERTAILQRFASGETRIVCNVGILSEGYDLPAIDCIVLARPTKSLALYLQQVGRGLRAHPDKRRCLVLDHAGCAIEHGLATEHREWSLDAPRRRQSAGPAGPSVTICESCFAAYESVRRQCPFCGEARRRTERTITQTAGELVLIESLERKQRRSEQGRLGTMPDLIELARKRGYKNPVAWARHVFNGRRKSA